MSESSCSQEPGFPAATVLTEGSDLSAEAAAAVDGSPLLDFAKSTAASASAGISESPAAADGAAIMEPARERCGLGGPRGGIFL
jgi:hypothetical protein